MAKKGSAKKGAKKYPATKKEAKRGKSLLEAAFIGVNSPVDQQSAVVRTQSADDCNGDLGPHGVASKENWFLADLRARAYPGWTTTLPSDPTEVETAHPMEFVPDDDGGYTWSGIVPGVDCTSQQCPANGERQTLFVRGLWEQDDGMAGTNTLWEWATAPHRRFIGRCQAQGRVALEAAASPGDVVGQPIPFFPKWFAFRIDVNARGAGSRLMLDADTPLRGKEVACFASKVDWKQNGTGAKITSPRGSLYPPRKNPRYENLVPCCTVLFQLPDGESDALIHVVSSESGLAPVHAELHPTRDIYAHVNALRSGIHPHTGEIVLLVKVTKKP